MSNTYYVLYCTELRVQREFVNKILQRSSARRHNRYNYDTFTLHTIPKTSLGLRYAGVETNKCVTHDRSTLLNFNWLFDMNTVHVQTGLISKVLSRFQEKRVLSVTRVSFVSLTLASTVKDEEG